MPSLLICGCICYAECPIVISQIWEEWDFTLTISYWFSSSAITEGSQKWRLRPCLSMPCAFFPLTNIVLFFKYSALICKQTELSVILSCRKYRMQLKTPLSRLQLNLVLPPLNLSMHVSSSSAVQCSLHERLPSNKAIDRKERKLNCLFYHKMCLNAAHILTPREQGDAWPNGGTFCAQLSAFASVDDLKQKSLLHFF